MAADDSGLSAAETQQLLRTLAAIRQGDFTVQMSSGQTGVAGEVAESMNALMEQLRTFAVDASRLAAATGVEGRFGTQMSTAGAAGMWKDLADNLNHMSLILAAQVQDITRVAEAVAEGDLSKKVTVVAGGEMEGLKNTLNSMIDQLATLKSSVAKLMEHVHHLGVNPEQPPQQSPHNS